MYNLLLIPRDVRNGWGIRAKKWNYYFLIADMKLRCQVEFKYDELLGIN